MFFLSILCNIENMGAKKVSGGLTIEEPLRTIILYSTESRVRGQALALLYGEQTDQNINIL